MLEHAARQLSAGDPGDTRNADVHRATDVCLQEGRFSVDQTASFLADSAADATKAGFPLLRVIVEMGWLVRQPEAVNNLLRYESAVDQVVEQVSAVAGEARPRQAVPEDRRQPEAAGERWGALTESERRITTHVVSGLTNREKATVLVVSRHTVDAHLKHIYIKLGIHTRVELTVLALHHPFLG